MTTSIPTEKQIKQIQLNFLIIEMNEAKEYLKEFSSNPFANAVTYNKKKLSHAKREIKIITNIINNL